MERLDLRPMPVTLPGGRQLYTPGQSRLQQLSGTFGGDRMVYPARFGAKPVMGPLVHSYTASEMVVYRLNDVPAKTRSIPLFHRASPEDEWTETRAIFDVPDLLKVCRIRGIAWWEGTEEWTEFEPRFGLQRLSGMIVLPDGTLLVTEMSQHPEITDRVFSQIFCLQSTDEGRTWTKRGVIVGDTEPSHGYQGEKVMRVAPDGDLVCLVRTLGDLDPTASRWLAQCRSTDGGYTWSAPRKIAELCVTPQLIVLANRVMVAGYGRPGVYLRTSGDNARTWSDSLAVHGPSEQEQPDDPADKDRWFDEHRKRYSCGNISTVVTGPDRFLLAYSDFRHPHPDVGTCKAILVREVVVNR